MTYRQTEQRAKGEARSERERLPRAEGEADDVAGCLCNACLASPTPRHCGSAPR